MKRTAQGINGASFWPQDSALVIRFAWVLLCFIFPSAVIGHHSTATNFDRDTIISINGLVTKYRFQNPHVQILMDVTNEDGEVEAWMVELAAKNQFVRAGWSGDEFKPGQIITVIGWKGYRERSTFFQKAILQDGTEVLPPRLLTGRVSGPAGRDPDGETD